MKNKITYIPIGILTLTTALSGVALSSARVAADTSGTRSAAVTVSPSCTFTGSTSYTATMAVYAGNTTSTGETSRNPYTASCNNPSGFVIKAVGASPDADHSEGLEGNTAMYSPAGLIQTGTAGPNSYWGFKITYAAATAGTSTVTEGYNNTYTTIPSEPTTIISYSGSTSNTVVGLFRPDYQVYVNLTQPAGTYTGAVKYTLVPNA